MLVNLSNFLQHKWYILVIIVAAIVFGLKAFGKTEPGSLMYAKIGIKFPLFGNLTIKSARSNILSYDGNFDGFWYQFDRCSGAGRKDDQ